MKFSLQYPADQRVDQWIDLQSAICDTGRPNLSPFKSIHGLIQYISILRFEGNIRYIALQKPLIRPRKVIHNNNSLCHHLPVY